MNQQKPSTWAHLKATVRSLKLTAKVRTRRRRQLRDQLRARDLTIERLRTELDALRKITTPQPVPCCHYPAQMMALAVFMVLHGSSLRCAAATLGFFSQLMGWNYKAPAFKTVSNWVERCGLHALQAGRSVCGEYVGIIDASIQIGKEQLLLLLGVPIQRAKELGRPLTVADVTVIGMEVQSAWNGNQVKDFMQRLLDERPGLQLSYVVCDQGGNLMAAMRSLGIPVVNDCSHVMMNLVKKLFDNDTELSRLCGSVGQLRQNLLLTDHAFALPPRLRTKDRFLRIFTLVDWMDRIDAYGNGLSAELRALLNASRNRWLDLRLRQVRQLLRLSATILKSQGLSQASYDKWVEGLIAFNQQHHQLTQQAKDFMTGMMAYFERLAPMYRTDEVLLCCSDIIESIFGKYKNKGGMMAISADVLAIALYGRAITPEFVLQAMTQVSGPQVEEWRCQYVCHNRYGIRKRMEAELLENDVGRTY